jgi:protein-tyrosine kinase
MSLVEKALKKLHESRLAAANGRPAIGAPTGVTVTAARRNETTTDGAEATRLPPTPPTPLRSDAPPIPSARSNKVVTVNLDTLRIAGLVAVKEEERRVASEYRSIKRPLIAGALGRGSPPVQNGRVIMVASALPGEGKTFTSVNLALNMALEKDTSVLLVDADLPKPQISRVFGVGKEPGLVDALLDDGLDVESLIVATSVRGLSLLPAGRPDATSTELRASNRKERLLARLMSADPRRIVLFDSSPLLLTTESRALAAAVGQIVIVVRAEFTTQQAVLDAVACLPEGKSVGLVLNQSPTAPPHFYYGYGDYGGSQGEQPAD